MTALVVYLSGAVIAFGVTWLSSIALPLRERGELSDNLSLKEDLAYSALAAIFWPIIVLFLLVVTRFQTKGRR